MQLRLRLVSTFAILALAASLAVAPGLIRTATAAPAPAAPERSTVTAECAAAQAAHRSAKTQKAKAKRKLVKAKKTLRKAKHSHSAVKIKKAKRQVKKAKARLQKRKHNLRVQAARVGYACSAPTSAARATGTGQELQLLVLATGTVADLIDSLQLGALLERLLPGVGGDLSPAQLTALLSGFNSGALSLDDATILLGSVFTPEELTSLLDGTAGPALVLELANHIIGQLSGLGGGLPIPGGFDPTDLLETIAGVFGTLDPTQLGGLLDLLLTATGNPGETLDLTRLTDLLDGLIPGLSGYLTPTQASAMLDAVNAGGLDSGTLSNLLGGQFSAAQLDSVLGATATDDLKGMVVGNIVAQLGTLDGSALALPGAGFDATGLLGRVTGLVGTVLTGVGTIVDGVVCTLLPILC